MSLSLLCGVSGASGLQLGSIGFGSYLGDSDRKTDDAMESAVIHSVTHGSNVIDTGKTGG